MKVAITSTNGIEVNQHFGKATSFLIYEKVNGNLKLLEKRSVDSYCQCENNEPVDPNHKFSEQRFRSVLNTINDCTILYTQKIGNKPGFNLMKNGIKVMVCNCTIAQI